MDNAISLLVQPKLDASNYRLFLAHCREFSESLASAPSHALFSQVIARFREVGRQYATCPDTEDLKLLVALHVMADLAAQGWEFERDSAYVKLTRLAEVSRDLPKDRVRQVHLIERDAQLREPAVAEFIRNMERRRLTPKGWHSIFSLMRDGRELAERLRSVATNPDEETRSAELSAIISPYIQFVEPGAVCDETGLVLSEIWRYFRHSWVNAYRSIPGRSLTLLVRDAAAPGHPVMGIAALGSSVVQQAARDSWIEWDGKGTLKRIESRPPSETCSWLLEELDRLIRSIYVRDLKKDGLLTARDIAHPGEDVLDRLRGEANRAIARHRKFPQKSLHNPGSEKGRSERADWEDRARSHLFRSKRCKTLATLLSVRRTFQQYLMHVTRTETRKALRTPVVRAAVVRLVRLIKGVHVGNDMMDITVCGALPPYNHLLGGKLVCLLLCSPEVISYYAKRYRQHPSVIASSMHGEPILRNSQLVLLCTTSLYGTGSSQYNRIKVPARGIGGKDGEFLAYQMLGYSEGFGSFHFSRETVDAMNVLVARSNGGRRVNSIFGEGVNPLLRKIRDALDIVGLPSDVLLRHGNRRIVYGVPLARNFREVLLGLHERPQYPIPHSRGMDATLQLVQYWYRRWVARRIAVPGVLERVSKHTLEYPIRHGARVPLESENSESLLPWFGKDD